jgi:tetratricopeptide (TPR) repeat protein
MVPLLLVPAGYLLSELRTVLASGWRGEGGRAAVMVGLGLFLGWASESRLGPLTPGRLALDWSTSLRNRAEVKVGRGDPEAARRDLLTAVDTLRAAGLDEAALHASLARLDRVAARGLATGADAAQARAHDLLEAAKKELATAMALDADDATVLREQGLLQFDQGQDREALATLTVANAAQPRDREVLQHLALVQLRLGNGQAAQGPARALVDLEPHADDGWGLLALGLLQDGNVAEARAAVVRYDSEAKAREVHGLARRLPESPEFAALRPQPPPPP